MANIFLSPLEHQFLQCFLQKGPDALVIVTECNSFISIVGAMTEIPSTYGSQCIILRHKPDSIYSRAYFIGSDIVKGP